MGMTDLGLHVCACAAADECIICIALQAAHSGGSEETSVGAPSLHWHVEMTDHKCASVRLVLSACRVRLCMLDSTAV